MPSSDDPRVEEILERWFDQQFANQAPDLDELCAESPHLLPRVREMLERYDELVGGGRQTEPRRPLPTDRLGDYELKSRIGSGGMGDVYLARDPSLDRLVALKVLRRDLCEDPIRRLRFKREAQLTAALDHPNIVPVYGTGEDQGHVFLVMKRLPGTTLDRTRETRDPRRIAAIGAQVARALHAAHEVGIVHRDVKPGNIQVDGDEAWVLDFGLARGRVDLTLTTEGQAPGTLAYMPPEQLRGDNALDPRGDIYALGATLYQCVAGRAPFDGDSPEVIVRRALIHDPEPLRLDADRDLGTIILRALDKDPARRFPTALEFAEDLERFVAGEPIRSRPPSTVTRAVRLARRHRTAVAALAAALLVALVLLPLMWRDARERAVELTRQFDAVEFAIGSGTPAVALFRLRELEDNSEAHRDPRHARLRRVANSFLVRDALLDRIQLDSVHRRLVLEEELANAMASLPGEVREKPLTLVGLVFLAHQQGDRGRASRLLRELEGTGACRRFVAAFRAALEDRSTVDAIDRVASGSMPVEDHVFTAVTLRIFDAPSVEVDAEIESALAANLEHPRARMMLGVQHWIRMRPERAIEVFRLLLDEDRPRAELHVMIAQVANWLGDLEQAAKHIRLADTALAETNRPPNRQLELTRITRATLVGSHESAAALLAQGRRQFGDDEWFQLCEAGLHVAREDHGQAYDLLTRLAQEAEVPWNRRRARSTVLQIDVKAMSSPSEKDIERLIARAATLAADSEAVDDLGTLAEALMVRARLASLLYDAFDASGLHAEARRWEDEFWQSLLRVLEVNDLHEGATFDAAQHVVNRIRAIDDDDNPLAVGDQAAPMRRRAAELTRRGYRGERSVDNLLELATFAAFLSAKVADQDVALEMGAIANHLVEAIEAAGDRVDAQIELLLDLALESLETDVWPQPPPRATGARIR